MQRDAKTTLCNFTNAIRDDANFFLKNTYAIARDATPFEDADARRDVILETHAQL